MSNSAHQYDILSARNRTFGLQCQNIPQSGALQTTQTYGRRPGLLGSASDHINAGKAPLDTMLETVGSVPPASKTKIVPGSTFLHRNHNTSQVSWEKDAENCNLSTSSNYAKAINIPSDKNISTAQTQGFSIPKLKTATASITYSSLNTNKSVFPPSQFFGQSSNRIIPQKATGPSVYNTPRPLLPISIQDTIGGGEIDNNQQGSSRSAGKYPPNPQKIDSPSCEERQSERGSSDRKQSRIADYQNKNLQLKRQNNVIDLVDDDVDIDDEIIVNTNDSLPVLHKEEIIRRNKCPDVSSTQEKTTEFSDSVIPFLTGSNSPHANREVENLFIGSRMCKNASCRSRILIRPSEFDDPIRRSEISPLIVITGFVLPKTIINSNGLFKLELKEEDIHEIWYANASGSSEELAILAITLNSNSANANFCAGDGLDTNPSLRRAVNKTISFANKTQPHIVALIRQDVMAELATQMLYIQPLKALISPCADLSSGTGAEVFSNAKAPIKKHLEMLKLSHLFTFPNNRPIRSMSRLSLRSDSAPIDVTDSPIPDPGRRSTRRTAGILPRHISGRDEDDPADKEIFAVYPIDEEAQDAVTIYRGDLKRLQPTEYLNDSLIDFRIKQFLHALAPIDRERVHVFSCLFYTKLCESRGNNIESVKRWARGVDLFAKDFVLVPINIAMHWSLVVIVRPGLVVGKTDEVSIKGERTHFKTPKAKRLMRNSEKDQSTSRRSNGDSTPVAHDSEDDIESATQLQSSGEDADENVEADAQKAANTVDLSADGEERTSAEANVHSSTTYTDEAQAGTELTPSKTCSGSEENNIPEPDQPCFLCMDSLRAHSMVTITRKLRNYLEHEWRARQQVLHKTDSTKANMGTPAVTAAELGYEDDGENKKQLASELIQFKPTDKNMPWISCKVPLQTNGVDCGVYVCKFAELILKLKPRSTLSLLQSNYEGLISPDIFTASDVYMERALIHSQLDLISPLWAARVAQSKKRRLEEKVVKRARAQTASDREGEEEKLVEKEVEAGLIDAMITHTQAQSTIHAYQSTQIESDDVCTDKAKNSRLRDHVESNKDSHKEIVTDEGSNELQLKSQQIARTYGKYRSVNRNPHNSLAAQTTSIGELLDGLWGLFPPLETADKCRTAEPLPVLPYTALGSQETTEEINTDENDNFDKSLLGSLSNAKMEGVWKEEEGTTASDEVNYREDDDDAALTLMAKNNRKFRRILMTYSARDGEDIIVRNTVDRRSSEGDGSHAGVCEGKVDIGDIAVFNGGTERERTPNCHSEDGNNVNTAEGDHVERDVVCKPHHKRKTSTHVYEGGNYVDEDEGYHVEREFVSKHPHSRAISTHVYDGGITAEEGDHAERLCSTRPPHVRKISTENFRLRSRES